LIQPSHQSTQVKVTATHYLPLLRLLTKKFALNPLRKSLAQLRFASGNQINVLLLLCQQTSNAKKVLQSGTINTASTFVLITNNQPVSASGLRNNTKLRVVMPFTLLILLLPLLTSLRTQLMDLNQLMTLPRTPMTDLRLPLHLLLTSTLTHVLL
jgi:hypothetical protein